MKKIYLIIALLIVLLPTKTELANAFQISGKAQVIDGDTIVIKGISIRLSAIDAPEINQPCKNSNNKIWKCGKAAAIALKELIKGRDIKCKGSELDAYKRKLMFCSADGIEINKWMVSNGWAYSFVKYDERFLDLQKNAQKLKLGIFKGELSQPWVWRNNRFLQEAKNRKDGCVIKGNISSSREKIYHLPHQQHYGRTKIDEHKGEKWFCKEEDAIAMGWRRSLR